jgi:hypothetical protein
MFALGVETTALIPHGNRAKSFYRASPRAWHLFAEIKHVTQRTHNQKKKTNKEDGE